MKELIKLDYDVIVEEVSDKEARKTFLDKEEYFKVQSQLGSLAMTRKRLDVQYDEICQGEDELNVRFMKNREIENTFIESINEKYGAGTLDPATGEFTPAGEVKNG